MSETPFKLRADQSLNDGVRRIMRDELQAAIALLTTCSDGLLDERVHELRKTLKRLRAMLRLVRPAVGEAIYRRENKALRDAARPFSPLRDAKILVDALEELGEALPNRAANEAFAKVQEILTAERQRLLSDARSASELWPGCRASLHAVLERVESWPPIPDRWRDIGRGLGKVYRRGRKDFRRALTDSTPAEWHDWRKQAKYLRHQLELLSESDSKKLKTMTEQAAELATLLGEDHDLVVLSERLNSAVELGDHIHGLEQLLTVVEQRRSELERAAAPLGRQLYRRRTNRFVRRVRRCCKS
jgi:CHAD domain-containing protein